MEKALLQAMLNCADRFSSQNKYLWTEQCGYSVLANELANELTSLGYRLEKKEYNLEENETQPLFYGE